VSTSTIQAERRACARKSLNPLPYIHLPSDNGGIVLDVSEGGLRFRATTALEPSGSFPFWFKAHSNRIEGEAEIVWLDEAAKIGGLRFTNLPQKARDQIRKWPADPTLRPSIGEDFALHVYAPEPPRYRWYDWRAARAFLETCSRQAGHGLNSFATKIDATLGPMMHRALAELRAPIRSGPHFQMSRPRILKLAGGVFLGIVLLTLSYTHRRQAGDSLIWMGMRISGQIPVVAPPPAMASVIPQVEDRSVHRPPIEMTPANPAPQPMSDLAASAPVDHSPALRAPRVPAPNAGLPKINRIDKIEKVNKVKTSGTELLVQVAALTKQSEAHDLVEALRGKNFPASVRMLPADSLYRVVLGPYADKTPALAECGKLERAGYHAFIRREPAAVLSDLRESRPANF